MAMVAEFVVDLMWFFSRIPSQNSPLTTFNGCVTHTLMKELS